MVALAIVTVAIGALSLISSISLALDRRKALKFVVSSKHKEIAECLRALPPEIALPAKRVLDAIEQQGIRELDAREICELGGIPANGAAGHLLVTLVSLNVLTTAIRVSTLTGQVIQEFDSIQDVPDVIHNPYDGTELEVDIEHVNVVYKVTLAYEGSLGDR